MSSALSLPSFLVTSHSVYTSDTNLYLFVEVHTDTLAQMIEINAQFNPQHTIT